MDITDIVERSRASEAFKRDVHALAAQQVPSRITTARHSPRVKVLRLVAHLLETHPELPVERIHVDAWSGCSDFAGEVTVEAQNDRKTFEFTWCCLWRAEQEGWYDMFGLPDQIRAAQEFGWRCFQRWDERATDHAKKSASASSHVLTTAS